MKIANCILLLFSAILSAGAAETNLASADPGFEMGTKYWYFMKPVQYASLVKGAGINGTTALQIRNPEAEPARRGGIYRKGFISVSPGEVYTCSIAFKGELTAGYASVLLNFFKKDGDKNKYLKTVETVRVTGEKDRWERLYCTFTVPPEAELLHFGISAVKFTGTILFDDIRLTRGSGAFPVPLIEKPLAVNGKWDADFAAKALRLTGFMKFPLNHDELESEQTEVFLAQSHDMLCGVFLMHHAPGSELKTTVKSHDGPVWQDDCTELFITHTNTPRPYYHFMFNLNGAVFDALENNPKWNSSLQCAGGKLSDSASFIQFALPLKEIGYDAELDAQMNQLQWKMNFTRSHHGAGAVRYSTFAPVIAFHNPDQFVAFSGLTGGRPDSVSARYWNRGNTSGGKAVVQRHWKVKKPQYKELLSDNPNPLKGESAFIWGRPIEEKQNTQFAIQYGMPYTLEMMLEEYRKNRLHPYTTTDIPRLAAWGKKTGVGIALYAPYYLDQCAFLYSPEGNRKFLKATRDILEKHHEGIWAVSLGDEVFSQALRRFVTRANKPEELAKDPALKAAAQEVLMKYGGGQYGVPSSVTADEPFRWIALRRWALDRMLETQKQLTALCKEFKGTGGKPILVISPDHVDWAYMQHQSRLAPYQDIITAQTVPMNDPNRQILAFRSKLLRDLTGKSVWLCAHIEPYAGNYDSEETAAFLSETVRGGGSGLQIWNYDLIADNRKMGSSQFDYYGHRPRWNTIMGCLRNMRNDNLPTWPEPDYAVLVSNDTAFAHPKERILQPEAVFNLFGPGAGSWFRFISDVQLIDGTVDLSKWKTVLIPKANILDRRLLPVFQKFLADGGTLVCFDPYFMDYDTDGNSTAAAREALFGAKAVSGVAGNSITFMKNNPFGYAGKALNVTGASCVLQPLKGTEMITRFQNGKAAATVKHHPGGGCAILTAFEPQFYQSADPAWRNFAVKMLNSQGIKTGLPIWNFQYPHKKEQKPVFKYKYLTGNNFYFWNNAVRTAANVQLPQAYYTYSLAPDNAPGVTRYSFADGNLTNRLKASTAGDLANFKHNRELIRSGKLHRGLFADTWNKPDKIEICFFFGETRPVHGFALFWNGTLPDFTVSCGGNTYPVKGGTTKGVEKAEVSLPGIKADSLTVRIPRRPGNEVLLLSEAEIQGE